MMYKKYLLSMIVVVVALCNACTTENDNTEAPMVLTKRLLMNGVWKVKTLTIDDVDKTAEYPDMEINFADATYKASNSYRVWPAEGAWTLKDEKTINRDNEIDVLIGKLDEQTLTLSLTQSIVFEEGRTSTIGGRLVYELVKK